MTVKELRELLAEYDDSDVVILQKDSEGGGAWPLSGGYDAIYVPDSTWSGNVYLRKLTDKLVDQGCGDDDVYDGLDGQNALVLHPIN